MKRPRCSDAAYNSLKKIAADLPEAYVEIATVIDLACESDLVGELLIAILNNQYDVYLLEPNSPGLPVLLVAVPSEPDVVIADVGKFSAASEWHKRNAAVVAAQSVEIVVTNIHVVP